MADNVEIQGLEFQIVNDSTQAVAGLQNLIDTLNRLKTAINGGATGLNKTAKGIRELSNSLKGLNSGDASQKITRLAHALAALSQVGSVKISSSIANQLTAINTALAGLKWTDGDKLTSLADGLRPLSELGRANMTTFITQLSKLPKVIEDLEAADIDKFTRQMKDLAAAMKPFADEMQKVSNGFSAFPSKIQKVIASSENYNSAMSGATARTNTFGTALRGLKFVSLTVIFRKVSQFLGSAITRASEYLEDMNLFTVSMGEYAEEAYKYAQKVSEIMGIDPAEWMRNQGVFNTIITGFGVASDKAALMSKNLTQLGYDISSFYNIPFAESMQKVQSGIAGELEPLRRIGYDLSVARLQQEAYNLGINKSVSAMTQAEKAQLRYYTMMTQVTQVQGDMARTLEQPTNMIRVLKAQLEQAARAVGDLFIPALTKVLPIAIAVAKALREIIVAVAALFGVELQTPDWDNAFGGASVGSGEIADNMDDAAGAAKKLKHYVAGFDELNVFSPNDSSGSGFGTGFDSDLGIDLPEYGFLKGAVTDQIDEWQKKLKPFVDWIKEHLEDILATVTTIGAGFLAWKFAKSFLTKIKALKDLLPKLKNVSIGFEIVGLAGFLDSMHRFSEWVQDFMNNGPTLDNIVGMLTSFAGGVGWAFTMLGNIKVGSAFVFIDGLGQIFLALRDMSQNGVNMDNVLNMVHGLGNILTAVGLFIDNPVLTGGGLVLSGITTIIEELRKSWDAIKQADWSGVDFGILAIGAIEAIGGILIAVGKIKGITEKIGGAKGLTETSTALQGTADAIGGSTGGGLNGSLKNIAQNLGWGITIIAEVSAAAIIVAGTIWILGEELTKVGEAWEQVINNAGMVATAIGLGAGLLAGVGAAAYGLGTSGASAAKNIAVGTGILLELGVAAGVFITEVWAIGEILNKVSESWKPVIEDGDTVTSAIVTGTALLVGIGAVTALLGIATIATGPTLPLAIAAGTGMLLELGVATGVFITEIWGIGEGLNKVRESWKPVLDDGDTVKSAIVTGTALLVGIGAVTALLGVAAIATGLALPLAIAAGTAMLLELGEAFVLFTEKLVEVANELSDHLSPAFRRLNKKLPTLTDDTEDFVDYITDFADEISFYTESMGEITWNSIINKFLKLFAGNPIKDLADDVSKIESDTKVLSTALSKANPELENAIAMLTNYATLMSTLQLLTEENGTIDLETGLFTNLQSAGEKLVTGFATGITNKVEKATSAIETLQTSVEKKVSDLVDSVKTDWDSGFSGMSVTLFTFRKDSMTDVSLFVVEFNTAWGNLWISVANSFTAIWNGILRDLDRNLDASVKAVNDAINDINRVYENSSAFAPRPNRTGKTYVSQMASGGFVNEGQLFIAREAGAEMVGNIGRRTAVANNDQIVESISAGVTVANDGVIAAIYELINALNEKDMSVSIGDDAIGHSYDRYREKRGRQVSTGAFANSY